MRTRRRGGLSRTVLPDPSRVGLSARWGANTASCLADEGPASADAWCNNHQPHKGVRHRRGQWEDTTPVFLVLHSFVPSPRPGGSPVRPASPGPAPPPPPRPLAQAHTSPYLLTDAPQHAPFCSSSCGTRPPRARVCEGGRRVRALARMELFSGSPHESNHIDPGSELLLTEAVGSAFATQVQQNSGDVLGIDVEQPSLRSCR